jgi:predicted nucleic acid-binding protein
MSDIAVVDSGFVYALLDDNDQYHRKAWSLLTNSRWDFRLPPEVLVEVFHNRITRRVSLHQSKEYVIQQFAKGLRWVVEETSFRLETATPADYKQISELLQQYADAGIDYVDAIVIAMAERLQTPYIMTVDEKDFRLYRPRFTAHFKLPLFDS